MLKKMTIAVALLASSSAWAGGVTVSDGWIRLLPGKLPAAAYCTISNRSGHEVALTGASAVGFKKAMLHQSKSENGQEKMVHVMRVAIPAGQAAHFAPGGYHIMLMPPHDPLKVGDTVKITLKFADGSTVTEPFAVKGAGATGAH